MRPINSSEYTDHLQETRNYATDLPFLKLGLNNKFALEDSSYSIEHIVLSQGM